MKKKKKGEEKKKLKKLKTQSCCNRGARRKDLTSFNGAVRCTYKSKTARDNASKGFFIVL